MEPTAIEPATVSLVLSYLVPLDAPLPPRLVSRPLLQRHHFLSLSIDNPREYLAWPTRDGQDADAIAQLLSGEGHLRNPHDLQLNVRYSADEESLQAHVEVITSANSPAGPAEGAPTPSFRLIFQWDPTDGWQYHNTALMPFPRDTYPTISEAYAAFRSPNDFLAEPNYPTVAVAGADDDDDGYWDSYGQDLDDGADEPSTKHAKAHPDPNSEDAYWARYSSIHGSADSTIPSPLPVKRNPDGTQTHAGVDRIFIPSTDLVPNLNNEEPYNPLEPPSPEALHERLVNLSPRPESPPFEEEASSEDTDAAPSPLEPVQPTTDPLDDQSTSATNASEPLSTTAASEPAQSKSASDASPNTTESDSAFQQSIQGLYRLWKLQQQQQTPDLNDPQEAFLTFVRRAIEQP